MLEGLLWTVLGLIGFTLAALAVPIDVVAQLDLGARTRLTLRVAWLFGVVRVRREMGSQESAAPEKPKERRENRGVRLPHLTIIRRGFDLLAPLLSERWRVIAFDARGHGESDWADAYDWPVDVVDIVAILRSLGRPAASARISFARSWTATWSI